MTNENRPTSAMNILGPRDLDTHEFECILKLSRQDGMAAVVLRNAVWSHRGRWHLSGLLHCLPADMWLLGSSDMAEIVYEDKSSEIVHWRIVKGDPAHQVSVAHGRFGAYVEQAPRFPRGRNTERQAGVEVTTRTVPDLHKMLARLAPGLDQQRRAWLIESLQIWRDREVGQSNARIARLAADEADARSALRRKVTSLIDAWSPGDDDEQVRGVLDSVERVLDLDEKGLPY